MPRELLQLVLGQELDQHADGQIGLIDEGRTFLRVFSQIQVQLFQVLETNIVRIDECGQAGVGMRAHFERDFLVQFDHGELVEGSAGEADGDEVGRTDDLDHCLLVLRRYETQTSTGKALVGEATHT